MSIAYIALGSNLGDRYSTLSAAVRRLRAEPGLRLIASSAVYETAPLDCPPNSGDYLNSVVAVETERSPEDLLQLLLQIEHTFGRVRSEINAPRTLDLDLLLHGDRIINTPDLVIPHPRMHERAFVLVPLAELSESVGNGAFNPVLKKTASQLLDPILAQFDDPNVPRPQLHIKRGGRPPILPGHRALVTGSTTGIGCEISVAFEEHGADVIRHGRRAKLAPSEPFVSADLRDETQVDRLAAEAWELAGGLDVLVCNAGADTLTGDAAKWSFDQKLEALLAVDLKATMRLARTIGARMKERGRGCIITIGWDQAETGMEGDSGQLFAAVKGAVMCFTRSLALSLAPEVRVNCIAPGWIRTAWGETASDVWQDRVRDETPLGVWGLPEDVASAAVWLASPAAGFMTGQTIRVNGGAVR
ncbi:MAG: 2-amino-4-hydroxy-6-hydroxymethyldihydropteridine diphosphokinase [Planctomycetes bacterium]|nr:2-amino-4-hydroxy-6-hydroxymethyldihydropteridine diphosphokinase [Planctomycetota bacterium]